MTKRQPKQPEALPNGQKLPKVGDFVLLGCSRASYPGEWTLGEVLWIGGDDVLIDRHNWHHKWRELGKVSSIRAIGTIAELNKVEDLARKELLALKQHISECEVAFRAARDAMWKRLGEMADNGLQVIPPDFAKMDEERDQDFKHRESIEAGSQAEREALRF